MLKRIQRGSQQRAGKAALRSAGYHAEDEHPDADGLALEGHVESADEWEEEDDLEDADAELDEEDDFAVVEEDRDAIADSAEPRTSWAATDDPVRMYLMQMGEIPLLNRGQEVAVAREIERAGRFTATGCWPTTICCRAPCGFWKGSATANCVWTAPSKCR